MKKLTRKQARIFIVIFAALLFITLLSIVQNLVVLNERVSDIGRQNIEIIKRFLEVRH